MVNTPMVSNFSNQANSSHTDMVANATAMKLQALSTVNNRVQLDDARKYRRSRSSEGQGGNMQQPMSAGLQNPNMASNMIMTNDLGQVLSPQQAASLQAQQLASIQSRSRPNSPGMLTPGQGPSAMTFGGTTNNGFLSAYDGNQGLVNGIGGMHLGHQHGNSFGSSDGYPHDERHRGRSPRGKRGVSRPPEDPTDIELLKDIPGWLRSLRLHKYTDNLKDIPWTELIEMSDADLDKRGVNALGARRKMTKVG